MQALFAGHGPATAEEKKEEVPGAICGGCVSATHTTQGKGSITPYGRIELDGIYGIWNTNPLDPGQFNGYATAAGKTSELSAEEVKRHLVV